MIYILPPKKDLRPESDNMKDLSQFLLTRSETAEFLRVSESTIVNLTKSGEIPCIHIGRSVRYSFQVLHDYIEKKMK